MNAQNYVIPTLFPSSSSSSLHKIAKNPQPPQPLKSKEPSSSNAYLKFTDVNINEEEDLGHQCVDSQRMTIAFKHKNSGRVAQVVPQDQFRKKEMSVTPSQPTSRLSRDENMSSRQSDYPKGYTKQMGPHYQQKKITGKPLMVMHQKNFMLPKASVQYGSHKPKSKVKRGSKKQLHEGSFNKKPKHKNMGQPPILGLSSKEPSYKMSLLANAEGSSFHEKRFSDGPSLSGKEDDHSTPEMIGDDSETQIKQESDSEFGTNDQAMMNAPYQALKHTNLSIIKKKSIHDVNKLNPRGPLKKTKGSFANTDNFPDELQLNPLDKQKYQSVRKQKNQDYININQNYQPDPSNGEDLSPIFLQYAKNSKPKARQVSAN